MCELNLWGIETAFVFVFTFYFALCELNLWGIETVERKGLIDRFEMGVNWTCEGLKLIFKVLSQDVKNRVNWTCEGLKFLYHPNFIK